MNGAVRVNGLEGSDVSAADGVADAAVVELDMDELEGAEDDIRILGIAVVVLAAVAVGSALDSVEVGVGPAESVGVGSVEVTAEVGVTVAVAT